MRVLLPRTLDEALEMKAVSPDAVPIAGGTDVMVLLNFDRLRPPALLDVSRVPELQVWRTEGDHVFLGAGVTYSRIIREFAAFPPFVQAARTDVISGNLAGVSVPGFKRDVPTVTAFTTSRARAIRSPA